MDEEVKKCLLCDEMVAAAAVAMSQTFGASVSMIIDRLLTYAAAQAVSIDGSKQTAQVFHRLADRIDAGIFARFEDVPTARRN